jgi:NADH dehydrogenase FAD-containing subunit
LPYFPLKARRLVAAELQKIGVEVSERRTTLVSGDTLVYSDGSTGDADFLVVATGARPSNVLTESGLEVDDEGAVIVDEYLQSLSAKGVFGGGDCVAFQPMELERSASHALRQGRVLFANLLAYLSGEPMRPFIPKKEPLTILNLGRTGLLVRKPFVARGRFALLLKRWIDRRIVKEFQSPSEEKS